MLANYE